MTNSDFNRFRNVVAKADNDDFIWNCGYLWLNLTDRQCAIMYDILKDKGMEQGDKVVMPSGIEIMR